MQKLIGNRSVGETLQRLVAAGRVANALLFAGPEGVGKKQFALELARTLMCTERSAGAACGECRVCNRIGEFSMPKFDRGEDSEFVFFTQHPDVGLVLPYKRNLRVGAIRALELEAHYRPYEAAVRVFIIDDADKMNDNAANALLKTLEEPAATSHIILIASRADSLLPTILSRCQIIRFGPVDAPELEKHLLATEQFSADDAALAARVSGGSVGRALNIVPASFRTQRSLMLEVVSAAVAGNKRELLAASEEMSDAKNKDEYEENLEILRALVHDVWLLKNGAGEADILNVEVIKQLRELSENASTEALARWLAEIETMYENFLVNINRKIATDALFLKMTA